MCYFKRSFRLNYFYRVDSNYTTISLVVVFWKKQIKKRSATTVQLKLYIPHKA